MKSISLADGGLAYRIEKEKARRMREIFALETGLTTPVLLDADDARGLLVFERMARTRPFSVKDDAIWFERAGRALAVVHQSLRLPDELTIVRAADRHVTGTVFVHGDFMPNNLGIGGGQLVLFDWGLRPWTREVYTCAAGSVDLAAFLSPWLVPRWWDPRLPVAKLKAMLGVYFRTLGQESVAADLAFRTLANEMGAQYEYLRASIQGRSIARRPIASLKLRFNQQRLGRGLANLGMRASEAR